MEYNEFRDPDEIAELLGAAGVTQITEDGYPNILFSCDWVDSNCLENYLKIMSKILFEKEPLRQDIEGQEHYVLLILFWGYILIHHNY